MPDNVWAVDARSGREMWHFKYPPNEGGHIGQRGVAMLGDTLYFETPDCNLIALNAKDGTEKWRKTIADVKLEYFCTMSAGGRQPRDYRCWRRFAGQSRVSGIARSSD